jgi:hypothetical protein
LKEIEPARLDFDFPHPPGPMLKGRPVIQPVAPKYLHAVYKPTEKMKPAGAESFKSIVWGSLFFALAGALFHFNSRRKQATESMVVKEAWAWVAGILPQLEKAAEKTIQAQDFNRLAQLEAQVHSFEQVLDSLDVPALVKGGVFESEQEVRTMRKEMLARIEALEDKIERAFPAVQEPEEPVKGAGLLGA